MSNCRKKHLVFQTKKIFYYGRKYSYILRIVVQTGSLLKIFKIRVFWNANILTATFSDLFRITAFNISTLSATSLLVGWCRVSIFEKDN
jgi:hypothetical protein